MPIGCVYLARNTVNDSIYIGKSISGLAKRKRSHERAAHKRGQTAVFCNALIKYGFNAFEWSELYVSDDDRALLDAEVELIAAYKAAGCRMYNLTVGGDGLAGVPLSPARKEAFHGKVSRTKAAASISASWTPERKAAQAEKMRRRTVTDAQRKAVSDARKSRGFTPEHRAKINASLVGRKTKPWTPERRAKIEAAWARRRAVKRPPQ